MTLVRPGARLTLGDETVRTRRSLSPPACGTAENCTSARPLIWTLPALLSVRRNFSVRRAVVDGDSGWTFRTARSRHGARIVKGGLAVPFDVEPSGATALATSRYWPSDTCGNTCEPGSLISFVAPGVSVTGFVAEAICATSSSGASARTSTSRARIAPETGTADVFVTAMAARPVSRVPGCTLCGCADVRN